MASYNYRGGGRRGGYHNPSIQFVEEIPGRPPRRSVIYPDPASNNYKLHVRSIPKSWTKIMLTNVFAKIAQPVDVYLNESTNPHFNWGFVEFQHYKDAATAIKELDNNLVLDNIRVSFARDKYYSDLESSDSTDFLEELMNKNTTSVKPMNPTRTVMNTEYSYDETNDNDRYVLEHNDETLKYVEEGLFQMVLKHYNENPTLGKCSLCKKQSTLTCVYCGIYYCTDTCQRRDWPEHQKICQKLPDNDKDKITDAHQRPMHSRDSTNEPKEYENRSKDNFNSYSKQEVVGRGNHPFRDRRSAPFANSQNSGFENRNKNERPRDNHNNNNAGSKNMFQDRKSRFDAEKQTTGNGTVGNRRDGPRNFQEVERQNQVNNGVREREITPQGSQSVVRPVPPSRGFDQPKQESIPKDRLECGRVEKVIYAWKSEDVFHVQVARDEKDINALNLALNDSSIQKKAYSPVENGICMASYEGMWSRCQISKMNPCEVLYIDYGNTELVNPHQLFTIPGGHATIPPFAVKIKLAEGSPQELEGCSIKPTKKMQDFWLVEVDGFDYSKQNTPAINSSSVEVSDVNDTKNKVSEVSRPSTEGVERQNLVNNAVGEREKTPQAAQSPSRDLNQPKQEPTPKDSLECGRIEKVIHVLKREDMFYIQLARNEQEMLTLNLALNDPAIQKEAFSPVENGICMVSYEEAWCRCQIIKLNPCEVFYMDYGNTEVVNPQQLFTIPGGHATTPPFAVKIKLAEGSPQELEGSSIKPIKKIQDFWLVEVDGFDYSKTNTSAITSSSVEVPDIKDTNEISVSDTSCTKNNASEISGTSITVDSASDQGNVELKIGTVEQVTINTVEVEGTFVVHQLSKKELLLKIMKEIGESHSSFPPYSPVLGGMCLASLENVWFRGKVINLSPLEIEYIDFGNTENHDPNSLLTLPQKYVAIPPLAIKIKLAEGTPDIYMKKTIRDELTIMPIQKKGIYWEVKIEENPKLSSPEQSTTSTSSLAQDEETNKNTKVIDSSTVFVTPANNQPVEQQVQIECAKNDKYSLKNLPEKVFAKNKQIKLLVAQSDPLYVQLQEDLPAYSELVVIISEYVGTEQNLYNPCVGELCIAKNPDFGEWYRCVCLKEAPKGIYTLKLIDFGNIFEVPTTDIRIFAQEMAVYPAFAKPCKIKGLPEDRSPELQKTLKESVLQEYNTFEAVVESEIDDVLYISAPSVINSLKETNLI